MGCDFRINSGATEDACGVCNGNNSTCAFTNGSFLRPVYTSGEFGGLLIARYINICILDDSVIEF